MSKNEKVFGPLELMNTVTTLEEAPQPSVITDHRLSCNHNFDCDSVEVLDEERNYKKRLIFEMIHIKKQKVGLNSQNDTELLDPVYNDFIIS